MWFAPGTGRTSRSASLRSASGAVKRNEVASSAVLIAAALDNDWLLPGRRNGLAPSQVDRMLNIINSCDRVLMRYHLLYGKRCPQEALGYTGLVGGYQLGADRAKIEETDACCIVGPEHYWGLYFGAPSLVARMVPYVFWNAEFGLPRAQSSGMRNAERQNAGK